MKYKIDHTLEMIDAIGDTTIVIAMEEFCESCQLIKKLSFLDQAARMVN